MAQDEGSSCGDGLMTVDDGERAGLVRLVKIQSLPIEDGLQKVVVIPSDHHHPGLALKEV